MISVRLNFQTSVHNEAMLHLQMTKYAERSFNPSPPITIP